jgi:hypothetical protein
MNVWWRHPVPGFIQGKSLALRQSTRFQVAGLWISACSLALALLRTVFDVMEVLGR